jgi:hypothetical protein
MKSGRGLGRCGRGGTWGDAVGTGEVSAQGLHHVFVLLYDIVSTRDCVMPME